MLKTDAQNHELQLNLFIICSLFKPHGFMAGCVDTQLVLVTLHNRDLLIIWITHKQILTQSILGLLPIPHHRLWCMIQHQRQRSCVAMTYHHNVPYHWSLLQMRIICLLQCLNVMAQGESSFLQ